MFTSLKIAILVFTILLLSVSCIALDINYSISFPEPHTHYVNVEMRVNDLEQEITCFQLPVWAPGSYMIRDFSKNVESFEALTLKGKTLKSWKTSKNTWEVENGKSKSVTIKYKVYAFEMSVRTSFIDEHHAFLNGSNIFMYVPGLLKNSCKLTIYPWHGWNRISTALPKTGNKNTFIATDYDQLADCPIEIGNHQLFSFEAAGVTHEVAMYGPGNYDVDKLKIDMARLVEACTSVFNENPNDYYLFIIHNLDGGGGGLEHSNSTTLQVSRWGYMPENRYKGFLSLVTHEYFHLWNVKRIRPKGFWDIDFSIENYTDVLWVMEGFTSYYDDILMKRAGYFTEDEYLRKLAGALNSVDYRPGDKIQSVAEASFDAWIKFYHQNENSFNTTVSYYTKGNVLAAMLDLMIIDSSRGKKSMDDVMRYLYHNYNEKNKSGVSTEDVKLAIEQVSGKNLDSFFTDYVYGTKTIDYEKFLNSAGLEIYDVNVENPDAFLGVGTKYEDCCLSITSVIRESAAYKGGLNVNDEIIAMDGFRVDESFTEKIRMLYSPSDTVTFLLARDGMIIEKEVILEPSGRTRYTIYQSPDINKRQNAVRKKWFTGREE